MIIRNRIAKKDVTELDVLSFQESTGITNEEIVDYLVTYPKDPVNNDLLTLLCDLVEPSVMYNIVYSKRSKELLARTWPRLFDPASEYARNNYLHVFLESFDLDTYVYIIRDQPRYLRDLLRMPVESWKQGHGEIVHMKLLCAFLGLGLNDLAKKVIEKYSMESTDLSLAITVLLEGLHFGCIMYLYENMPCADLQVSPRDLLKVPLTGQSDDFKRMILMISERQPVDNELYILLLLHYPIDQVDYLLDPKLFSKERLLIVKKMMAKLRLLTFYGDNYFRIMSM